MGYNYSESHVAALVARCREVSAWAPPAFWQASAELRRRCYNGINSLLEAFHRHPPVANRAELKRLLTMCAAGLLLAVLCQTFGWQGFRETKIEVKNA